MSGLKSLASIRAMMHYNSDSLSQEIFNHYSPHFGSLQHFHFLNFIFITHCICECEPIGCKCT